MILIRLPALSLYFPRDQDLGGEQGFFFFFTKDKCSIWFDMNSDLLCSSMARALSKLS
jgi:hypothetical protein